MYDSAENQVATQRYEFHSYRYNLEATIGQTKKKGKLKGLKGRFSYDRLS